MVDFDECLKDINHVISCLYDFSVAIRNPAPPDRLEKCSSIDASHFELFDIQRVTDKFPGAQPYLHQRLGKANVRRRQLLQYYQMHHDKISGRYAPELPDNSPDDARETAGKEVQEIAGTEDVVVVPSPSENEKISSGPPAAGAETIVTKKTETTIWIFPAKLVTSVDIDARSVTDQSCTSFSMSVAGTDAHILHVPAMPEVDSDVNSFKCPICFDIVSIRSGRSWK